MAAGPWKLYDDFKEKMADGTLDMDDVTAGTFKVALFTATHTPAQTDSLYSALANEVANGNGYLTGGVALTGITWVEASGTVTWDCVDPYWDASGGDITAKWAVIYDVSTSQLIAVAELNTTGSETVTDGNTMTLVINANGIFQSSGGWA